jgi:ABC-type transport system substrate-binding protein
VLLLALALLGCDTALTPPIPAAHQEEAPVRGGVLHLSSFADIRALDPANISDGLVVELHELLFAGLVDYDDDGKIALDLAESYRMSDDGKAYTFTLRQGVRFHSGEELTAADVKRSVERALHPDTPNPFSSFFNMIEGYKAFSDKKAEDLSGVHVEGRYLVSFHLTEPDATFLPLLAMHTLRPVCPNAGARYSDTWHACGAGPFMLPEKGWDRGREINLVRHPAYFRPGLPHLDGVTMTFFVNFMTEKYKFARGEIDVLREFQQPDLVRFQNDPRWLPFGQYEADKQINGEMMNTEMAPFDNVELRRAVAAAIDREHYRLLKPTALRAATQPIPPSVPFHEPSFACQTHDLGEALEHMKKAGYPYDPVTGTGGYPHPIPYVLYQQSLSSYTAQVLQQDLAKIGIRLQLQVVNYPTYLALLGRRKTTAFAPAGWNMDFPDPSDFTDTLFHTRAINDEDSSNYAFYSNPSADALMDRAKRELDQRRRAALYHEIQKTICNDAPWAFTHYYRFYDVHQPYVRNYRVHPVWSHNVRFSYIDRASDSTRAALSRVGLSPAAILPRWP